MSAIGLSIRMTRNPPAWAARIARLISVCIGKVRAGGVGRSVIFHPKPHAGADKEKPRRLGSPSGVCPLQGLEAERPKPPAINSNVVQDGLMSSDRCRVHEARQRGPLRTFLHS
ncbi:MAG: hypothetical protein JWL62_3727, partial [Hyphomicrobiales bacterium]|nr:hypothetical protein [Hyphomicrobiales bacterium]